jgi:type I restriction enzyme S subunit
MEVKPGYKQTEVGLIPDDWSVASLGGLLQEVPQYGINAPACPYSAGLPTYIRITDISDAGRFSPAPRVSVQTELSDRYSLRLGDVVLARTGASVGKSYLYDPADGPLVYAGFLIRVRPDPTRLNSRFLSAWLKAHWYLRWVVTMSMRSGQPGINGQEYGTLPLPLPPLPEQKAIAHALSDTDHLIQSLERLIAKKRDLKQATMQQLLTGETRLPGFDGEWVSTTLGDIGECVIGLTYEPDDVVDHGLLVLRASNVQAGRLAYDDNVYVKGPVPDHLRTRTGDILICVRNGSRALIGKCAAIDDSAAGLTFGAFMSVYRTPHWQFVLHAFQAGPVQRQIRENIGATINQITNRDLRGFCLLLPPRDEQAAIAEVLSDMDAEITALEARLTKTRDLKQGMMQELLTGKTRLV